MLDNIKENQSMYHDQQFIPCFKVESNDKTLKARIESILMCIDHALYPIAYHFDCIQDFNSIFDHGMEQQLIDQQQIDQQKDAP